MNLGDLLIALARTNRKLLASISHVLAHVEDALMCELTKHEHGVMARKINSLTAGKVFRSEHESTKVLRVSWVPKVSPSLVISEPISSTTSRAFARTLLKLCTS